MTYNFYDFNILVFKNILKVLKKYCNILKIYIFSLE